MYSTQRWRLSTPHTYTARSGQRSCYIYQALVRHQGQALVQGPLARRWFIFSNQFNRDSGGLDETICLLAAPLSMTEHAAESVVFRDMVVVVVVIQAGAVYRALGAIQTSAVIILYYARWQHKTKKHSSKMKIYTNTEEKLKEKQ